MSWGQEEEEEEEGAHAKRNLHIAHFFCLFFLFRTTHKFLHSLSSRHLSACALTNGWGCQESQSDEPAGDTALRSSLASCASRKWASWKPSMTAFPDTNQSIPTWGL